MRLFKISAAALMCAAVLSSCGSGAGSEDTTSAKSASDIVIETIMTRRSVRQYQPAAVGRDTMKTILECGINAPNGMNRQSWEIRVVDSPEFINGLTELYVKSNPRAAEDPSFKNMFRNAPTVVFIAHDPSYDMSAIDCGLLGENMILSAWSMGIGSCCLGGPVRFMKSPEAADYLKRLGFSEGYRLVLPYTLYDRSLYCPAAGGVQYLHDYCMVWTPKAAGDETY